MMISFSKEKKCEISKLYFNEELKSKIYFQRVMILNESDLRLLHSCAKICQTPRPNSNYKLKFRTITEKIKTSRFISKSIMKQKEWERISKKSFVHFMWSNQVVVNQKKIA